MSRMHFRAVFAAVLAVVFLWTPAGAVDIKRLTTPKGIEVWFVPDASVPLVAVSFTFKGAGAVTDPAGKEGLADMASSLLDEGAGELKSQDYQREVEEIAAQLSFDSGRDHFSGRLRTLSSERDRAFELLRLALVDPRFDEKPVARIRSQILASLRQQEENPNRIGGRLWAKTVWPDHPYARPAAGTEASIGRIERDDLLAFVRDRFARDRLIVGVVGDIPEDELKAKIDAVFGALPEKSRTFEIPYARPKGAGKTLIVRKHIPQSVVMLGHAGISRDDPDWYAALLVTRIFGGGGLSSRLYEEVREKRGLAYSVYAYLSPMDYSAIVAGSVATQNARAGESLDVIRAEWQKLAERGLTADELADAKTYANGSFPLRLGSSRRIADMLVAIRLSNLGIDYINRRPDLINAVTLEQANRVARRLYRAKDLTVVVVGDPKGITEIH